MAELDDSKPVFWRVLPFMQLIAEEQRTIVDRIITGQARYEDHYHKLVVLAIGIAGIVVPFVVSQGTDADPVFLRHGVIWLGAAAAVGLISLGVSRWVTRWTLTVVAAHFQSGNARLWAAGEDEQRLADASNENTKAFVSVTQTLNRVVILAAVGDMAFFVPLLIGIFYVVLSVTGGTGGSAQPHADAASAAGRRTPVDRAEGRPVPHVRAPR
jgi:hypothetical protein